MKKTKNFIKKNLEFPNDFRKYKCLNKHQGLKENYCEAVVDFDFFLQASLFSFK